MTHTLEGLSAATNSTGVGKNSFAHLFCHIKPYKGINNKSIDHIEKCFYNEKEWRFVPFLALFSDSYNQFYTINDFPKGLNDDIINHRLYKLHFKISDINYLIVKSRDEKNNFLKALNSDYSEPLRNHDFKVFSMDEVYDNF